MRQLKYWIKERHNPQLSKPYFVPCGQLLKAEAERAKNSLYGYNIMHDYETEAEYIAAIEKLKAEGKSVQ